MSSRGLDILYVGTLPPHPGGSAISAAQLLAAFAARGNTVRALAPIPSSELDRDDRFASAQPAIAVTRFAVPRAYTTAYRPPDADYHETESASIRRLLPEMIDARRPDIVLVGRESFAWHVAEAPSARSLPCVLRAAGATAVGIAEGTYPARIAEQLIERCRRMSLVITPSEYLGRELRKRGLEQTEVIANAVDLDTFRPTPRDERLCAELGIEAEAIAIAFVGNLNERKRPLDLVRSSLGVLERSPRAIWIVVGDGPLAEETKRLARSLGVESRFRFAGWQPYERIPQFINLADIVVLPSFGEGLARVYLETQACGRVLVASDIPPAREVIDDGETGLLFPVGDVDGLAACCIQAAAHPERRARIGWAARERSSRHAIGPAVTRYLAAFETLAATASPRTR